MQAYGSEVVLRLKQTLPDAERISRYEQPLARELADKKIGEIAGGKALRGFFGGGKGSEIRLRMRDTQDDTIGWLRTALLALEPGQGAELRWTRDGDELMMPLTSKEPEVYDPAVIHGTARSTLQNYRSLFADSYTWLPADPADFPHVDHGWYDASTAAIVSAGFEMSGDLRLDPEGPVKVDTYARKLRAKDGRAYADLFNVVTKTANKYTASARTELSDGTFLVSTNTPQMWNDLPGFCMQWLPPDTSPEGVARQHLALLERHLAEHPALQVRLIAGLQDIIDLENRSQASSAASRRAQGTPSGAEMVRLGAAPRFAKLLVAEMQRLAQEEVLVQEQPAAANDENHPGATTTQRYGDWVVVGVDLPGAAAPMAFHALIQFALEQGIQQVERAGSPLNSFLIFETGRCLFMANEKGGDPMEIALQLIKDHGPGKQRCALVIDSRITTVDGKKTDAILAMACERGAGNGESWAQGYTPKGFLRRFRASSQSEKVAECKNLFAEVQT